MTSYYEFTLASPRYRMDLVGCENSSMLRWSICHCYRTVPISIDEQVFFKIEHSPWHKINIFPWNVTYINKLAIYTLLVSMYLLVKYFFLFRDLIYIGHSILNTFSSLTFSELSAAVSISPFVSSHMDFVASITVSVSKTLNIPNSMSGLVICLFYRLWSNQSTWQEEI